LKFDKGIPFLKAQESFNNYCKKKHNLYPVVNNLVPVQYKPICYSGKISQVSISCGYLCALLFSYRI